MIRIPVASVLDYSSEVNIMVYEDETLIHCNHVYTHNEELDHGYADQSIGDWRDDMQMHTICDYCDEDLGIVEPYDGADDWDIDR
jgi:hypothetical protein